MAPRITFIDFGQGCIGATPAQLREDMDYFIRISDALVKAVHPTPSSESTFQIMHARTAPESHTHACQTRAVRSLTY
jgi:hypothetical protein